MSTNKEKVLTNENLPSYSVNVDSKNNIIGVGPNLSGNTQNIGSNKSQRNMNTASRINKKISINERIEYAKIHSENRGKSVQPAPQKQKEISR